MRFENKMFIAVAICFSSFLSADHSYPKFTELKEELGLTQHSAVQENDCHLYIVHHGDTDWTIEERLQGWTDIPLNDTGRQQMEKQADKLANVKVDAIYSSSLSRAVESAEIFRKGRDCEIIIEPRLKGESHGNLEGLRKNEYEKDPHFKHYKSLPAQERIFYSVGENGMSKADVARLAIPAIRDICRKHPRQNVVIVTHGGVLKFINFLLGNYSPEEINEVPHGDMLRIDGDGTRLALTQ